MAWRDKSPDVATLTLDEFIEKHGESRAGDWIAHNAFEQIVKTGRAGSIARPIPAVD